VKRSILNEVLSRTPEIPLYHYTQQSGLLGIIAKREIWATHTQYLNDRREYLCALDVVREEIQALILSEQENRPILVEMIDSLSGVESMNVCVCSFSEERDSLSRGAHTALGRPDSPLEFRGAFLRRLLEIVNGTSLRAFMT
jgi:hypothetical protein